MSFLLNSTFGVFATSAGGAAVQGARDGVSLSGTNVVLGNNVTGSAGAAALTETREISIGNFVIGLHTFGGSDDTTLIAASVIQFTKASTGTDTVISGVGSNVSDSANFLLSSFNDEDVGFSNLTGESHLTAPSIYFQDNTGQSSTLGFSGLQLFRTSNNTSSITNVGGETRITNNSNATILSLSQAGVLSLAAGATISPGLGQLVNTAGAIVFSLAANRPSFAPFNVQLPGPNATNSGVLLDNGTIAQRVQISKTPTAFLMRFGFTGTAGPSITFAGLLTVPTITVTSGTYIFQSATPFVNGAGVAVGLLANSPVAGNPTKWIAINDGGTVRYIPAW